MKTRVLMLNRKIKFAAAIKEALESTGLFEVHPFTSVDAAADYLRGHPQHVALIDFTLSGLHGRETVQHLRVFQPDLPVIISPKQPEPAVRGLSFQGMVDMPFSARDIITLINNIVEQSQHLVAGANTLPIQSAPPDDIPESRSFSSLGNVIADLGGDAFDDSKSDTLPLIVPPREPEPLWTASAKIKPIQETPAQVDAESQEALSIFERLAREEPPLPELEENGTIGDLIGDTQFRAVMSILRGDDLYGEVTLEVKTLDVDAEVSAEPEPDDLDADLLVADEAENPDAPSPAQKILETALDDSTPLRVSLEELIANVERQFPKHALDAQPTPTKAPDMANNEPDFLELVPPPEDLPEGYTGQFADKTTQPSRAQVFEPHPERLDTEADVRTVPPIPDTLPEAPPPMIESPTVATQTKPFLLEEITSLLGEAEQAAQESSALVSDLSLDSSLFDTSFDKMATFEVKTVESAPPSDPYLAQLALNLTQVSLELAAEATLLTRDGQIVASAGRLSQEEIDELSAAISHDWAAPLEEARLRFVSVENSGRDYMLYSKLTDDDLTLSMVFAGTTPLRDIRKQGKRLLEALKAVPEPQPIEVQGGMIQEIEYKGESQPLKPLLPPAEVVQTTPYAFVWLIRDPNARLNEKVGQAIVTGMTTQLTERAWRIQMLQAHEDYVYLLADVPGDKLAQEIVRDLKDRSTEIARMQDASLDPELWADSYFILTPGRAIDVEEIQQFINFDRAM